MINGRFYMPDNTSTQSIVVGMPDFLTPELRENIIAARKGIPLTTTRDRMKGITRYIPVEFIQEAARMDSISALTECPKLKGMKVLTLIGKNDELVNQSSMRNYHLLIGGSEEGIRQYDVGHNIPNDAAKEEVIGFLVKNLK